MPATLDRYLLKALTRNWDPGTIADYPERLRKHEESIPAPIAETFQVLDAKATGLLTHVSMMIAGLGLIAPLVANHALEQAVIIFEMAVYLLIAIGCLRCLLVFHPRELATNVAELNERIGSELLLRRELYRVCVRAAIIFTILVFVTLPIMYAW
jgi:hypothetical protein